MTKRKTFRLSEQSRNSLKSELAKYKSGPPLGKIAKVYGVSLSTVNYHWATIQHARKVGRKLDKEQMVRSLDEKMEQEALRAIGIMDAEDEAKPIKPNGHITVTIDQAWLKPIVEEVARTEIRDYLQTAFRK